VDDSADTESDAALQINVLANDSDVDGDSLTVSGYDADSGQGGTVRCTAAGLCTYTPPSGFSGTDTFRYTASDGRGGSASARVTVVVRQATPANRPPAAVDDAGTTSKNTPIVINVLANDSDPDGDALTIVAYDSAGTQGGSVSCTGAGVCTYSPPASFVGVDTFSYTIGDGRGGTAKATVTVVVDVGNSPPVAVDDEAATEEDTPVAVKVLANDTDPDGDTLTVSKYDATSAKGGSVACTPSGMCTYTPAAGFSGKDSFHYVASDGNGGTDAGKVTVTVSPAQPAGPAVRINELLPVPSPVDIDGDGVLDQPDEWIELYNASGIAVDLGGWSLDDGEGGSPAYRIPTGTVVQAGGFVVFAGGTTGVALDDGGDQVRLLMPDGTLADAVSFGALAPNASYSRSDAGTWHSDWPPSPGGRNLGTVAATQTDRLSRGFGARWPSRNLGP